MPGVIPTQQEWDAAKEACDNARQEVSDKWTELTEEQQREIRTMGFDYYAKIVAIDGGIPQEVELNDVAVSALGKAEGKYEELLEELEHYIERLSN